MVNGCRKVVQANSIYDILSWHNPSVIVLVAGVAGHGWETEAEGQGQGYEEILKKRYRGRSSPTSLPRNNGPAASSIALTPDADLAASGLAVCSSCNTFATATAAHVPDAARLSGAQENAAKYLYALKRRQQIFMAAL